MSKLTSTQQKLALAVEIRAAVTRYLSASLDQARSQLPTDWAPMLSAEIGAAEADADGSIHVGGWRLDANGDDARLDYHPPGSLGARSRVWFRIELTRKSGAWEIVPPGVSFVHAWARPRE